MGPDPNSVEEYMKNVDPRWKDLLGRIRDLIRENLPEGFEEAISYKMIGYVVPHSIYPKGYHANPKEPLPFINLAAQKDNISLYHMGLYADPRTMEWFVHAYEKEVERRPDLGKSCIRFRGEKDVPFRTLGELTKMFTVKDYISLYERTRKH
jgi:uncharacterized protein YdhG (YjbR/CyaY superfamily)